MKPPFKLLLPLLLLLFAVPAVVQAQSNPGFTYTASGGTVTIIGYTGTNGNVAIPSIIDGLPVRSIRAGAFVNNGILANVTIPGTVILNAVEIMTFLLTPLGLDVRGMSRDLPLFYRH